MPVIQDQSPTILLRVAYGSVLLGLLIGAVVCLVILVVTTRFGARIPAREVWARWRERRMVWGALVILGTVAAILLGDAVPRVPGFNNLYWKVKGSTLSLIGVTGALTGYSFALAVAAFSGYLGRRSRRSSPPRGKGPV